MKYCWLLKARSVRSPSSSTLGKEKRNIGQHGDEAPQSQRHARIGEESIQRCPRAQVKPPELRRRPGVKVLHDRERDDNTEDQEPDPGRGDCDDHERAEHREPDSGGEVSGIL